MDGCFLCQLLAKLMVSNSNPLSIGEVSGSKEMQFYRTLVNLTEAWVYVFVCWRGKRIVLLGLLEDLRNLQWFWYMEKQKCHAASC